jgi:uncharacterized protein
MSRTPRKIVVAGATGLIGSQLARRLAERGDAVTVLARDPEAARRRVPDARRHLQWTHTLTEGEWREAIDGADAVVNLAGAPVATRWTESARRAMHDSRVLGTRHLVEAIIAAANPPAVLVNASAVGYYGASPAGPVTEDSPPGDDFLARLCAEWESEANAAGRAGVRVVTLRTGIVLDPEEGALSRMLPAFRLFVGGPIGDGRQPFPWIHREDELQAILWALDSPQVHGPLNLAAPGIVTNGEFSRVLGKVLRRPSALPVPKLAMRLLFGDGAIVVTDGQHVVPKRTEELGYRFLYSDLEGALRNLLC